MGGGSRGRGQGTREASVRPQSLTAAELPLFLAPFVVFAYLEQAAAKYFVNSKGRWILEF